MKPNEFIGKIAPLAQKDMAQHRILASLTIAQAILESGWGESGLTKAANNLFGIKGKYKGHGYVCDTFEYYNGKRVNIKAEFRKYPSWLESMNDHSTFIHGVKLGNGQQRYKAIIGETDYKKACWAIQTAGYATAPTYAATLIELIELYKLYKYDNVKLEYQVRVFSFGTKEKATAALARIRNLNYFAQVEPLKNEWQVRVFSFSSKEKANAALVKIKNLGYYAETEEIKKC